MPQKIDLVCNDGSPIGVTPDLIWTRGVGGAELAMLTFTSVMAERGHEVTVFNNPKGGPGNYGGVRFVNLQHFDIRSPRDVLIFFRSPNARLETRRNRAKRTIWWSCDQYTVGDFRAFSLNVDFVVCISPYHMAYHEHYWKIDRKKMGVIDLGVRVQDYQEPVEKIKNRLIFCSIPDRGLLQLHTAWPLIQRSVPEASLIITSDYTLWGASANNDKHRLDWAFADNVNFVGAVPRQQLIRYQQEAEIHAYPCTYEELFCISAAEAQVAGALPITSDLGALRTTNEFGIQVRGDPSTPVFVAQFVERVVAMLTSERTYLEAQRNKMRLAAAKRFSWDRIAEQWEYLFEEGKLP